jgi:hypothetical protein
MATVWPAGQLLALNWACIWATLSKRTVARGA